MDFYVDASRDLALPEGDGSQENPFSCLQAAFRTIERMERASDQIARIRLSPGVHALRHPAIVNLVPSPVSANLGMTRTAAREALRRWKSK